jgi:hypothetical protein
MNSGDRWEGRLRFGGVAGKIGDVIADADKERFEYCCRWSL